MFAQNVLFFQATKVSNRITKCKYFIKILWGPSISDLGFWSGRPKSQILLSPF